MVKENLTAGNELVPGETSCYTKNNATFKQHFFKKVKNITQNKNK
jgi:hypothetical protein